MTRSVWRSADVPMTQLSLKLRSRRDVQLVFPPRDTTSSELYSARRIDRAEALSGHYVTPKLEKKKSWCDIASHFSLSVSASFAVTARCFETFIFFSRCVDSTFSDIRWLKTSGENCTASLFAYRDWKKLLDDLIRMTLWGAEDIT